jgi:Uma2 family endonuclease
MIVPASTKVSLEEYLATDYEPDCDYVDGQLEDRNVGKRPHSRLQLVLGAYFLHNEKRWGVYAFCDQRVQVSPTRVRVPDLCVVAGSVPDEYIFTKPPLLCIEILSPDDTVSRTRSRFDDYFTMGVPHVWLLDPESRRAWVATPGALTEVKDGVIRADRIEVRLMEVWPE